MICTELSLSLKKIFELCNLQGTASSTSRAEYTRRKVKFLQLLFFFKICTEFTCIIYIFENKFFYKRSIYSERSILFWISRDRNFLCMTLPYNIFGALCLSDSVINGMSRTPSPTVCFARTPSPTEKHCREYKHYIAGCRGRHPLQKNTAGNINVTQRDVEDAVPYRNAVKNTNIT